MQFRRNIAFCQVGNVAYPAFHFPAMQLDSNRMSAFPAIAYRQCTSWLGWRSHPSRHAPPYTAAGNAIYGFRSTTLPVSKRHPLTISAS